MSVRGWALGASSAVLDSAPTAYGSARTASAAWARTSPEAVLLRQVCAREWITGGDLIAVHNELFYRWASADEQGELAKDPARAMRFNGVITRAKLIAVERDLARHQRN
ncbi:hypothetical protein ACFWPK_23015 [Nocardia sp. NPDC058519]|uniref:hypothetical protein n=1 Tax=Nocardia sp. NPDC058519 TaxID=3346535 RepID=UPI0036461755